MKETIDSHPEADLPETTLWAVVEKIETVARFITANRSTRVLLGAPGAGNFVDQRNGEIIFDPDFIREDPNKAKLAGVKQSAESVILVNPAKIGLEQEVVDQLFSQTGFTFAHNILEGLTAEEWARSKYSGASILLDTLYADPSTRQGFMTGKIERYLAKKEDSDLATIPKFVQFGIEVERRAHQDWDVEEPASDPLIDQIVNTLSGGLQQIALLIPGSRSQIDRLTTTRERLGIFNEEIYPVLKLLIEHDIVATALDKAKREAQEQANPAGSFEPGISDDPDQSDSSENGPGQSTRDDQAGQKDSSEKPNASKTEAFDRSNETASENMEDAASLEEVPGELNHPGRERLPSQPMGLEDKPEDNRVDQEILGEIMQQLQKELEVMLEELMELTPEEDQVALGKAREKMMEIENDLNELFSQDFEHKDKNEHDLFLINKTTPPAIAPEDLIHIMKGETNRYEKLYDEVQLIIRALYYRIEPFFRRSRNPRWQPGFSNGQQLDLRAAMQAEAGEALGLNIWQKRETPRRRNYAFSLLLDCSGSMRGRAFTESSKGAIVLLEAFELLKIETQLVFFGNHAVIVKDWEDDLNHARRQYISKQLIAQSQTTATLAATKLARTGFAERRTSHKYMITITDGVPADKAKTKQQIADISKEGSIKMIGLGIGPETKFVHEYYPLSLRLGQVYADPSSRAYFPKVISDLVEKLILEPNQA